MRPTVIVVSLGMLAACGALAYMHANRDEPETAATAATARSSRTAPSLAAVPAQAATTAPNAINSSVGAATASSSSSTPDATTASATGRPDTLEQWIKDTRDSDPKIRAAAITKLANAPKAQALPVLKDVLETGEPEIDRHIALNSLHTLALRDGDTSGQVRDVMRRAIYHSDNDGVTQTAQSLLDDVEAALAEQQRN
jgi:HEAT repeat protein